MTTAPYREAPKYEYDVGHIGYECARQYERRGTQAAQDYLAEMSNAGWRLVAVADAYEAWTFFWERLR